MGTGEWELPVSLRAGSGYGEDKREWRDCCICGRRDEDPGIEKVGGGSKDRPSCPEVGMAQASLHNTCAVDAQRAVRGKLFLDMLLTSHNFSKTKIQSSHVSTTKMVIHPRCLLPLSPQLHCEYPRQKEWCFRKIVIFCHPLELNSKTNQEFQYTTTSQGLI